VTNTIIATLLAEESRLENELRMLPVFRRLEAVRHSIQTLRAAYEPDVPPHTVGTADAGIATKYRQTGSLTGRVVQIAEVAMRSSDKRLKSSDVLNLATREGVEINGMKPQSVVASILSHERMFDNGHDQHGSGYGLREWSTPQPKTLDEFISGSPPANEFGSQQESAESQKESL
jgi:hypothetical protein